MSENGDAGRGAVPPALLLRLQDEIDALESDPLAGLSGFKIACSMLLVLGVAGVLLASSVAMRRAGAVGLGGLVWACAFTVGMGLVASVASFHMNKRKREEVERLRARLAALREDPTRDPGELASGGRMSVRRYLALSVADLRDRFVG